MPTSEPERQEPDENWEHHELYEGVKQALYSLPSHFRTDTVIEGISATDIFAVGGALGVIIETQVVETLNVIRGVWDPDDNYLEYSFVRQAQTFPDVLLQRRHGRGSKRDIIMGVELKGWYLLAKEGEPSFRFKVTPDACAEADLIVIVPWVLSDVISGRPEVFLPYVEAAKYAAQYRNYWWQQLRDTTQDTSIKSPENVNPYPAKSDQIGDQPKVDGGSNFGRFARSGIMNEYLDEAKSQELSGIPAKHWIDFFKVFRQQWGDEEVESKIAGIKRKLEGAESETDPGKAHLLSILESLESMMDEIEG